MTDLPTGWEWSTVDGVGRLQLGRQRSPEHHHGPYMRPYLRVANVFEDRIDIRDVMSMNFDPDEFERFQLRPGDVLLNEGQSPHLLGRPALYRGIPADSAFTNSLIRFQASVAVTPEWALAVFRHHMHSRRFMRESRITTNIAHLSLARLRTVEFPVPPLAEQRRIVEALDDHLSRLGTAQRSIDDGLRRLTALRRSVLEQIVKDVDCVQPLGALADTALGKMLDAKRAVGTPTPYLRNINVRWGHFDLDDVAYVPLTDSEREKFRIEPGDLLVCEGGEPGRCAVWTGAGGTIAFQKALHRVRTHSAVSAEWIAVALEHAALSGGLAAMFTGTTIKHLPQEQLRRVLIPVLSPDRQAAELRMLAELESAQARLRDQLGTAQQHAVALRRSLLQAAFSGRLVPQDPDDEPASVLLERIATARKLSPQPKRRQSTQAPT